MNWFSFKVLGACALFVGACSDDGVPLGAGDTDAAGTGTASAGESADTGPGTAVTTAEPTDSGPDSDPTATTSPTDTEGGTGSATTGPSSSSGGTDDSTGGSSSTGGTTDPECVMDEDCMLVDDCCTCDAMPFGAEPPECKVKECAVSTCTSIGLPMPAVQCNFGTCEVEEVSCDPMTVTCDGKDAIAPECPQGQAPRVVDGCWSGGCIPVEYCDVVPGCDACGEDEACVESTTQEGPSFTCVPIPPSCEGMPSCDCLGEACEDPFDTCNDGIVPKSGAELNCSCLAC